MSSSLYSGSDVIDLIGSSGRTRTYNPSVNSRTIYPIKQTAYLYFQ